MTVRNKLPPLLFYYFLVSLNLVKHGNLFLICNCNYNFINYLKIIRIYFCSEILKILYELLNSEEDYDISLNSIFQRKI